MNNHRMGLSVETFNNFTSLHQFFDILSLNDDKSGNTFISVIESKEYPIYAVMFHPEKPLFEWYEKEDINHSTNSIKFSQYCSNFFINECKKSSHSFSDQDFEYNSLIYNYIPKRFKNIKTYQQLYFFNQTI
ncbi:hypothetical protein DICPUDRAFT_94420 [Dictyostelium purpureum]|uniref:Folate gamma-glutamyl hydrolase n=1 Tax=Dictyostelium purpureum TaxID=5786 RepID=F0ZJB0_DICPU|nr:uncharacterized protein DICPUDRAFT_94420 [Dictyostelium purpureum]EGC35931.1 hypothetical protein DICPUDRAFT_94420 [Dictyostelium purpureum]|eukprot:XP_003287504.1 hypothetical protein DICPUDRAFT_94420 [Dictyostelium purpureum]